MWLNNHEILWYYIIRVICLTSGTIFQYSLAVEADTSSSSRLFNVDNGLLDKNRLVHNEITSNYRHNIQITRIVLTNIRSERSYSLILEILEITCYTYMIYHDILISRWDRWSQGAKIHLKVRKFILGRDDSS